MNPSTLPNIPWEDRPAHSHEVVWRYSANPIIPRDLIPSSNSIFNSAVVPFEGAFAGVFRCDNKKREMNLHAGFSPDGIHWSLENDPIHWDCPDPELAHFEHRYDPRVLFLEDRYYVTWCNGYHGPTIGIGYTFDFKKFEFLENALLPFNRNGVLFPRRINGTGMGRCTRRCRSGTGQSTSTVGASEATAWRHARSARMGKAGWWSRTYRLWGSRS